MCDKEKLKPVPANLGEIGTMGSKPPLLLITEEGGWISSKLARLFWSWWPKLKFFLMLLLLGGGWLTGHTEEVLQFLGAVQLMAQGKGAISPSSAELVR